MRNHPLDPNAIIFLCELELLEPFYPEVSHIFFLEDVLRLVDQLFTLINYINSLENLAKKFPWNPPNSCPTIKYDLSLENRSFLDQIEQKTQRKLNVKSTQVSKPSQYSIVRLFCFLYDNLVTDQYELALLYQLSLDPTGLTTVVFDSFLFSSISHISSIEEYLS